MLKPLAEKSAEKNERRNIEVGLMEFEHKDGRKDTVPETHAKRMESKGFAPARKSFIVPELPYRPKKTKWRKKTYYEKT